MEHPTNSHVAAAERGGRGLDATDAGDRRQIIRQQVLIAVTAVLLAVQLHEYAHALASVAFGGRAAVHGALAVTECSPTCWGSRCGSSWLDRRWGSPSGSGWRG